MGTKIKMDIKQLMCRLTEEELEQESKHLTGLLTEKMNLEIEKSSSARHYSDAIKSVDLKIEKQIPIVRDRQIERDVECRTEFNTPEPGKKTVTRLDTMEVIFEGQMTDSECQDLFINNGADEADEADDKNARGQKLLAAPIDAEEVIRIEEEKEDPEILKEGCLYEFNGKIYRGVHKSGSDCSGCAFEKKPMNEGCIDLNCSENHVFLVPADIPTGEVTGIGDGEETDESDLTDKTDKKEIRRPVVCGVCGHPGELYHLAQGKLICGKCLDIKNQKNMDLIEQMISNGKKLKFRPQFGFGCRPELADTTIFRFLIGKKQGGKGSSWGMPIYKPGNFEDERTMARYFYRYLDENGVEEE